MTNVEIKKGSLPENLNSLVNKTFEINNLPHSKHEAYTYVNTRLFALDKIEGSQTLNEPQSKILATDVEKDALSKLSFALNPSFEIIEIGEEYHLDLNFEEENHFDSAHFKSEISSEQKSTLSVKIKGENANFGSVVLSLNLLENAQLDLNILQLGDLEFKGHLKILAFLEKGAKLNISSALAGSKIFRQQSEIHLNGEEASLEINGVSILNESAQVHHHLDIRHNAPKSHSVQRFSTVLLDQSQASIDGTVYVAPQAQLVSSDQLIKSMLLSDDAKMGGKPNLEIYADDVKCSHGNTCGELEAEQVFYLESRGFTKSKAQQVLTRGFAQELIFKLTDAELVKEADALFIERLSIALDKLSKTSDVL